MAKERDAGMKARKIHQNAREKTNDTSAATPHVSAVAALVVSSTQFANYSPSQLKQRIKNSHAYLGSWDYRNVGRLDAYVALTQ